jgi:hypothetical protein
MRLRTGLAKCKELLQILPVREDRMRRVMFYELYILYKVTEVPHVTRDKY